MSIKIAPSILAADFANLQKEVEMLNASEADYIHVDIMDGVFVPNISFGFPVTEAIKRHAKKPLDVHLMIVDPDRYLEEFKKAGAEIISVHYEACVHLHRTLQHIRSLGCKAGVAVNPHTPIEHLENILEEVDMVLLMSVNPGFGGQKFIPNTISKVRRLSKMIAEKGLNTLIEIDGGVNQANAPLLVEAGANVLVAGNFVFSSENPILTIKNLKNLQ
ncbi:ribulose-phosphate 3-epimerase [Cecembia calidifontis]|jgi:ribulose-phosphate 3-epimerase|uniref:Ribulose-phosphate 3-epimerase n=1 Tax=Cecembia calidifontis TaxID=1187080 RepID=A0A4Q7PA66_9BACT|nr:ribulose-phosphate 3-epimerase [Cecembia calidifontis]RZS97081.1 ribulose-phosphate 3-epimerase [Cecembia calidifontis]